MANSHSRKDNVLDIQSITEEIQRLSQSVAWWNKWVIGGMAATAIAASVLVIAQMMVNREAKSLSEAQERFLKLKDEKLSKELSDKGVLIAEANERAANADKKAAEAQLELAKFKAPRTLTDEQRERITRKLKPFLSTTFEVVTYSGEPEPITFSNVIVETLVKAGWVFNPNNSHGHLMGLASGVVVVIGREAGSNAGKAGAALLEALRAEGVAETKLGHDSLQINPTPIAIKIQVAKKP